MYLDKLVQRYASSSVIRRQSWKLGMKGRETRKKWIRLILSKNE